MGLVATLFGRLFIFLLFASPGLFVLFIGLWRFQMYRRLSRLQGQPPHEDMNGIVQADGEARPLTATTQTPITRTEAVGYEVEVESYMKGGGPDSTGWHTVVADNELPPFELAGLADSVVVDPTVFERSLTNDYEAVVETTDDITPEIRAFFGRDGTVNLRSELGVGLDEVTEHRKLRLRERPIEPGEELIVVGHAHRQHSDRSEPRTVIGEAEQPGIRKWLGQLLLLTDRSELEAASRELGFAKVATAFGGFWVALSSVILIGPLITGI